MHSMLKYALMPVFISHTQKNILILTGFRVISITCQTVLLFQVKSNIFQILVGSKYTVFFFFFLLFFVAFHTLKLKYICLFQIHVGTSCKLK